jgi:hypothetical protein
MQLLDELFLANDSSVNTTDISALEINNKRKISSQGAAKVLQEDSVSKLS